MIDASWKSRRDFIKRVCVVAGSSLVSGGCSFRPDIREIAAHLISVLDYHGVANQIGAGFREADNILRGLTLSELTGLIVEEIGFDMDKWPDTSVSDTKALVDTRVRRDFTFEHVVLVDGWLISRTEAQLCALSSLYYDS